MPHNPPDDFHQVLIRIKVYAVDVAATIFFVAAVFYVLFRELRGLFQ